MSASPPEPAHPAGRRELGTAVAGCVLAAALVLVASGRVWVRFSVALTPLPAARGTATGHQVAAAATAFGLVVLAGAVALLATRRLGRQFTGVLVAAVGVAIVALSFRVTGDPGAAVASRVEAATGRAGLPSSSVSAVADGWPWLAAAGGVLAVAAGALTVLRGRGWPAMGRRYDARAATTSPSLSTGSSAARGAAVAGARRTQDEASMWDALDRGDDPTA